MKNITIDSLHRALMQMTQQGSQSDSARLKAATAIAIDAHGDQVRDQGTPYIEHPIAVLEILHRNCGVDDPDILITALLHDTLEDAYEKSAKQIKEKLGDAIFLNVVALSKEFKFAGLPKTPERLRAYYDKIGNLPDDLMAIKLCDRLHNIREVVGSPRKGKLARYVRETREVYLPMAKGLALRDARYDRLFHELESALGRAEKAEALLQNESH